MRHLFAAWAFAALTLPAGAVRSQVASEITLPPNGDNQKRRGVAVDRPREGDDHVSQSARASARRDRSHRPHLGRARAVRVLRRGVRPVARDALASRCERDDDDRRSRTTCRSRARRSRPERTHCFWPSRRPVHGRSILSTTPRLGKLSVRFEANDVAARAGHATGRAVHGVPDVCIHRSASRVVGRVSAVGEQAHPVPHRRA